jgi:hypothetical protein
VGGCRGTSGHETKGNLSKFTWFRGGSETKKGRNKEQEIRRKRKI